MMRRYAMAIWAVRGAPKVRSCSRARDAARSRSYEAARVAWMVAITEVSVESVEGIVET
jgi:hypothetical protein